MDSLAAEGLTVRVLVLDGAKDPDEYIRAFGREAFDAAVEAAAPMIDFKLSRLKQGFDLTASDGMVDFLKAAARVITPLSPVERDLYSRRLAKETGISEEAIRLQTGDAGGGSGRSPDGTSRHEAESALSAPAERPEKRSLLRDALAFALVSEEMLDKAVEYRYFFEGTDFDPVLTAMMEVHEQTGDLPDKAAMFERVDEALQPALDDVLHAVKPAVAFGGVNEYMMQFEIEDLKDRERAVRDSSAYAEGSEDLDKELHLIQGRIAQLKEARMKGEMHW
jgi:DNA primase